MRFKNKTLVNHSTEILVILFVLLCAVYKCKAQQPVAYFPCTNSLKDSTSTARIAGTVRYAPGKVGPSVLLNATHKVITTPVITLSESYSVEFLMKLDTNSNQIINLFASKSGQFYFRLYQENFNFLTNAGKGDLNSDKMDVMLDGINRKSLGYYLDKDWHHVVFSYAAGAIDTLPEKAIKRIYVDAVLLDADTCIRSPIVYPNTGIDINTSAIGNKFYGGLDEIAFYNYAITNAQVGEHYYNFKLGRHYNFGTPEHGLMQVDLQGDVDTLEYLKGYETGSYNLTALQYLLAVPSPRANPQSTLNPNFAGWGNWKAFIGDNVDTSCAINLTLAQKFHYYLTSPPVGIQSFSYSDPRKYEGAHVRLLNQHPEFKKAAIMVWKFAKPDRIGHSAGPAMITRSNLPKKYYQQNSKKQYINNAGGVIDSMRYPSTKIISLVAPLDSIKIDGQAMRAAFESLSNALTDNLDMVFENAEVVKRPSASVVNMCPLLNADYKASGLSLRKWTGKKTSAITEAYKNEIFKSPKASHTAYQEYLLSGDTVYYPGWEFARNRITPINGLKYAPVANYFQRPSNWKDHKSADFALLVTQKAIGNQMAMGDSFFNACTGFGWAIDDRANMRAAQALGLCKILNGLGAAWFTACNFNLDPQYGQPPANPVSYAYQFVVCAYAQALLSWHEEFFRNSYVMKGDGFYFFNCGDKRVPVVVRKHKFKNLYWIFTTIQPLSNKKGNAELTKDVAITLDGERISFETRRQGSEYIYDKDAGTMEQLDGWHEASDPINWNVSN